MPSDQLRWRVDTVDKAEMHTAEHFLKCAAIDCCVKIAENPHWLHDDLSRKPDLVQLLTHYPAGSALKDKQGRYWKRRAKVSVTRFHFLTPVGETQESFYEQKYLLNVPIVPEDSVITTPPRSWMQFCVEKDMCNKEGDALSCLHTAASKGFKYDDLKNLVQLFVDNSYLSAAEGHIFMADVPLGNETHEEEAEVTDALLTDPGTQYGTLLPSTTQNVQSYVNTFTRSQQAAFQWLIAKFNLGCKVSAAIVGPAGTGKSYLLNAVVAHCRKKGLVVAKLAPSGVAAHLIEGTTIHRFFELDIELKCKLQHGTAQTTTLRKTDVLVVDEFSMLDATLFRTIEGLCRRYAKKCSSKHPWGGRHVILLGDPAQLPAVSNRDIFGTDLWKSFSVLLLREVVRAKDPQLQTLLAKVRVGIHDKEVESILQSRCREEDPAKVDLNATVIICSKRAECAKFNELCLEMLEGHGMQYDAIDTDHNGMPLRDADRKRLERESDRLPDSLHLKVGARVVVRRNIHVERGWVNGTIAQVVSLAQNCIVLCQVDKPKIRLPLPRFKQQIQILGASYHIVRHQFPVMPGYAVTVHLVQGMTVKKAVVLLNKSFFESGQAYVALSRVRQLEDLTIWRYNKSAIHILSFYKQLLQWCDAQDVIRPTGLPQPADATYPSRPDTISNAPLALESMDQDSPHTDGNSQTTSKSPVPAKQIPSTSKKLQVTRKRPVPATLPSNSSKKTCSGQSTPLASSQTNDNPIPGPSPTTEWKKHAIAAIQKYTSIPVIDKTETADAINSQVCPELHPHQLDKVIGDGHCGFRAIAKSITGTESNHTALKLAVVAFMRSSCAGRRTPYLANAPSIDEYILEKHMDTTGWISDIELQFIASFLQITIDVFADYCVSQRRQWMFIKPAFRTQECMAPSEVHIHLRHSQAQDHFDRVVIAK